MIKIYIFFTKFYSLRRKVAATGCSFFLLVNAPPFVVLRVCALLECIESNSSSYTFSFAVGFPYPYKTEKSLRLWHLQMIYHRIEMLYFNKKNRNQEILENFMWRRKNITVRFCIKDRKKKFYWEEHSAPGKSVVEGDFFYAWVIFFFTHIAIQGQIF